METAPLVLEIGLVLLLAAALGWVARRWACPRSSAISPPGSPSRRSLRATSPTASRSSCWPTWAWCCSCSRSASRWTSGAFAASTAALLWAAPAPARDHDRDRRRRVPRGRVRAARRGARRAVASRCRRPSSSSTSPAAGGARPTGRPRRRCSAGACSRTWAGSRSRPCSSRPRARGPAVAGSARGPRGVRRPGGRSRRGSCRGCSPGLRSDHDLFLIVSVASGLMLARARRGPVRRADGAGGVRGGLAISDRAETAEARRRLLPFRDVFAVLFFVAVGTLIDPGRSRAAVPTIVLLVALVVVAKTGVAWVLAAAGSTHGWPARHRARADGRVRLRAGGIGAGAVTTRRGRHADEHAIHGRPGHDRCDHRGLGGAGALRRPAPAGRPGRGLRFAGNDARCPLPGLRAPRPCRCRPGPGLRFARATSSPLPARDPPK